jgi:mono/diheme cytochrome c family protein
MKTLALSLACVMLWLCGCERPHSDMGQQDKYRTYEPSAFFADGASARPLPAGVVARDDANVPGIPYAQHQGASGEAGISQVVPLDTPSPIHVTAQVLREGGEQFDIYCAVCHGRLGNGEGMIVQRGFTRPPSFHIQRLKDAPDAHIYNVITQGYGAMFSYSERVLPHKRWEIVAYIRALQAAPDVAGGAVSQRDLAALIAGGDRKTPQAGGGG